MPRLLLVLPLLPHDPGNGAMRSVRGAVDCLARAVGWEVRALATTSSETDPGASREDTLALLHAVGLEPVLEPSVAPREPATWRFRDKGVDYRLLDSEKWSRQPRHPECQRQFDLLYDDALAAWTPDLVLTFGGLPEDSARHERARAAGIRQVFAVRNDGYLTKPFFEPFQAVLSSSEYLSDLYRHWIGLESTALPAPMELDDVLAPEREPIFFTAVNPSAPKGGMFLARLAEELGVRRPDIPLLVVESRGKAGELIRAGLAGGFDLRRHENLMFSPAVPRPRDYLASARALLAPSVFKEPSGRVVAEALVNGVPPLLSGRGGMRETSRGAGFVLPLPEDLTLATTVPVAAAAVAVWLEVIERLADDEGFYQEASARANEAGQAYRPEVLGPRYVAFFEAVLAAPADRRVIGLE